jgi:two-component system, NarL family, nitrate/nitrite response regulator NarL
MPRSNHPGARRRPAKGARRSSRVRIVVADDQLIDRRGLVRMFEDERDFDVVGEAATLDETIRLCRVSRPDVLVLALGIAGQEVGAAIPAIRAAVPELRIVAISERGVANCLVLNPPQRRKSTAEIHLACATGCDCLHLAVTQGAMATVRRSADPEDLFRAIRSAAAGEAWYDATTASGILTATGPEVWARGARSRLSASELKVAALISDGRSNKEISSALGITVSTVKKHVGHVLAKLGLEDRLQAGLLLARNPALFRDR